MDKMGLRCDEDTEGVPNARRVVRPGRASRIPERSEMALQEEAGLQLERRYLRFGSLRRSFEHLEVAEDPELPSGHLHVHPCSAGRFTGGIEVVEERGTRIGRVHMQLCCGRRPSRDAEMAERAGMPP